MVLNYHIYYNFYKVKYINNNFYQLLVNYLYKLINNN